MNQDFRITNPYTQYIGITNPDEPTDPDEPRCSTMNQDAAQ